MIGHYHEKEGPRSLRGLLGHRCLHHGLGPVEPPASESRVFEASESCSLACVAGLPSRRGVLVFSELPVSFFSPRVGNSNLDQLVWVDAGSATRAPRSPTAQAAMAWALPLSLAFGYGSLVRAVRAPLARSHDSCSPNRNLSAP